MSLLNPQRVQLILWITAYLLISALIGQVTSDDVAGWYKTLNRPSFTPPDLVFPIVWTLLYACMAIAGWKLSLRRETPVGRLCFSLFILQSLVNWAWSFIFFEFHMTGLAFGWILFLIALVAVLILKSWDVEKASALLLLPYLLWIGFASALSGMIWILN